MPAGIGGEIEPERGLVPARRLDIGDRIECVARAGRAGPALADLEPGNLGPLRGLEGRAVVAADPRCPSTA